MRLGELTIKAKSQGQRDLEALSVAGIRACCSLLLNHINNPYSVSLTPAQKEHLGRIYKELLNLSEEIVLK